jgi:hypothetical protein
MKRILALICCSLLLVLGGCSFNSSTSNSEGASSSSETIRKNPLTIVAEQAAPAIDEWVAENELSIWGRGDDITPEKKEIFDADLDRAMTAHEYIIKNNPKKIAEFVSRAAELRKNTPNN